MPRFDSLRKLRHRRPQTVGGFKKCFEEQGQTREIGATGNARDYFTAVFVRLRLLCRNTRYRKTKGNKKENKPGDKLGDNIGNKMGDKGGKASGRRIRHPAKGNKREDKLGDTLGDKGTRPGEGGRTIQQREKRRKTSCKTSWETRWGTS